MMDQEQLLLVAQIGTLRATDLSLASEDHGPLHWCHVADLALTLLRAPIVRPADYVIGYLFGAFHDTQRHSEFTDPEHGERAAQSLEMVANFVQLELPEHDLTRLRYALAHHDEGEVSEDRIVQACWDADRLTIGRVGIEPDPAYFSPEIGRQLPRWLEMYDRIRTRETPSRWPKLSQRCESLILGAGTYE